MSAQWTYEMSDYPPAETRELHRCAQCAHYAALIATLTAERDRMQAAYGELWSKYRGWS